MPDYVSRHKKEWQELEVLVNRARRGVRNLSPAELNRLDVLYRQTTVQLSQVATRTRDANLIRYLNSLTARAHSVLYVSPRSRALSGAVRLFTETFPRTVARTIKYHAMSAGLTLLGAIMAYSAVVRDPAAAYAILPAGEVRQPGMSGDQLMGILEHGRDISGGEKFIFASFLFSHNLRVALLALATGVLASVPTVILLVYNGMILGALTAVYHGSGIYGDYWAWILPHGVTELTAVILCGGMGLYLGRAALGPGMRSAAESLKRSGGDVLRVCAGVTLMLVFAAIIESYLRQSHLPGWARLFFAAGTAAFWIVYFMHGASRERAAAAEAEAGAPPQASA